MHFLQNTQLQQEVCEAMTKANSGIEIYPFEHKDIWQHTFTPMHRGLELFNT